MPAAVPHKLRLLLPVELLVDAFEVRVGDVGVNLGGGDVAVAEQGLDRAQVGAVHQ